MEQIVIVVTAVVVGVDRIVVRCMVVEVRVLTGLQQDVAIPLHQYPVLTVDDHAASTAKRSPTHFQEFCRRI